MKIRTLATVSLLTFILLTAFLIRIQGLPHIPEGQLAGTDAYLYYWQAQIISEHGYLPERDMHRWLPLGRDNGQTLNLYPYALAYTHKVLGLILPKLSLYDVTLYAPVVCFCTGIGALFLFLNHTFGLLSASSTGVLLVTLPGSLARSTVGYSDRDAWCLMIGILAITTYLASLQSAHTRRRLIWTFTSGFTVCLGGMSWEGFGVFTSIILCVEIWRFLSSEIEDGLAEYLFWVCTFVPTLYFVSPAYRSGQGFTQHLAAFVLGPPVVLLILRTCRHFLLTKTPWVDTLKAHARSLAVGLTLASIAVALGYILAQLDTFASTTVPLNQSTLMHTVNELENPILLFWLIRYGSVFILGALGIIMVVLRFWKIRGLLLVVPFILFTLTSFYREPLDALWGAPFGNLLFSITVAACVFGFVMLAWCRPISPKNESTYTAFIVWSIFWIALTRDARRYDFFIGTALTFFTADLICFLADFYGNQVRQHLPRCLLKTAISVITLTLILFWTPVGGHAIHVPFIATKTHRFIDRESVQAFEWIKSNLPDTAVFAARWDYGSLLNVLAGVKTIIDQDHYIPHWIHLYNKHLIETTSEHEALEFLKTHTATHLMLTQMDPENSFLHQHLSDAFVPIYPTDNFKEAKVKIWKIHYPPDIQPNPKYLQKVSEE